MKIDRLLEHANGYVGSYDQIMDTAGSHSSGRMTSHSEPCRLRPRKLAMGAATQGAATPLEDLCATTCRAIDALATGDGACQSAIVHSGGLRWLLKLAKATPSYHPEIINAAFGAIAALALLAILSISNWCSMVEELLSCSRRLNVGRSS